MSSTPATTSGSRTAAYVVAGAVATIPVWFVVSVLIGMEGGAAAVVVLWASGIVWLLKKRQEDPGWDRRPVSGRRSPAR